MPAEGRRKKCVPLFLLPPPDFSLLTFPMRITGGRARGIPITLPSRGEIRPATDYIREAVFNSVGPLVEGARVLDLFAGTGAYGLEALSRGATHATLVDKNPAAATVQKKNTAAVAKSLGLAEAPVVIINDDATRWSPPAGAPPYDIIFADPPWVLWETAAGELVPRLAAMMDPGEHVRLILEAPGKFDPPIPPGWRLHRKLAKGKDQPAATILRREKTDS